VPGNGPPGYWNLARNPARPEERGFADMRKKGCFGWEYSERATWLEAHLRVVGAWKTSRNNMAQEAML